jgi:uncharacterized protein YcbX
VNKAQMATGKVVSIWRYPLKSMMGEELNSSYVTERGLLGDRTYALIDQETRNVASAKNPRKWGTLFDFHATFIDPLQDVENIPESMQQCIGVEQFIAETEYNSKSKISIL